MSCPCCLIFKQGCTHVISLYTDLLSREQGCGCGSAVGRPSTPHLGHQEDPAASSEAAPDYQGGASRASWRPDPRVCPLLTCPVPSSGTLRWVPFAPSPSASEGVKLKTPQDGLSCGHLKFKLKGSFCQLPSLFLASSYLSSTARSLVPLGSPPTPEGTADEGPGCCCPPAQLRAVVSALSLSCKPPQVPVFHYCP